MHKQLSRFLKRNRDNFIFRKLFFFGKILYLAKNL